MASAMSIGLKKTRQPKETMYIGEESKDIGLWTNMMLDDAFSRNYRKWNTSFSLTDSDEYIFFKNSTINL